MIKNSSRSLLFFGVFLGLALPSPARAENEPSSPSLAPRLFELSAGARLMSRSFRYTDTLGTLFGDSRPGPTEFHLPSGPVPFGEVSLTPWATSGNWLENVSVLGSFEALVGTKVLSDNPDYANQELDPTYFRYTGGLRIRLPIQLFDLGARARFVAEQFSIASASGPPQTIYPDTDYKNVDFGLEATFREGGVLFGAHAEYISVLSQGALQSAAWFPASSGYGIGGGGRVGLELGRDFDLAMAIESRAYAFDFNPIPDAAPSDRIAGGATDRYLSVSLGLTYRFPRDEKAATPPPPGNVPEPKPKEPASGGDFDSFD